MIIDSNCSWNRGSAAQVITTIQVIRKYVKDPSFVLVSDISSELDNKQCKRYGLTAVGSNRQNPLSKYAYLLKLLESIIYLLNAFAWSSLKKIGINASRLLDSKILNEFHKSDLIIDLSGDSLSDFGSNSLFSLINILTGICLNKKFVVYSQSIGPFRKMVIPLVKFCLNKASLIIIREDKTQEILEKIGLSSRTFLAPDVAFILKSASKERVSEIFLKEGIIKADRPLIGLGTNILISHISKPKGKPLDLLFANIVDYLIEKIGAQVMLIPHVVVPKQWHHADDIDMAKKVYQKVLNKRSVKIIDGDYSPEDLKGIISTCDMFIGARMHSNIASTSMSVPTVALSWSHKYHGIMKMLNQGNYSVSLFNATFEEIISRIKDAWSHRTEIKNELDSKMPEIKKSVERTGELIKNLLTSFVY